LPVLKGGKEAVLEKRKIQVALQQIEEAGHLQPGEWGEEEVRLDHLGRVLEKLQEGAAWQSSPWTWSTLGVATLILSIVALCLLFRKQRSPTTGDALVIHHTGGGPTAAGSG
jgi:hypothetical protein